MLSDTDAGHMAKFATGPKDGTNEDHNTHTHTNLMKNLRLSRLSDCKCVVVGLSII